MSATINAHSITTTASSSVPVPPTHSNNKPPNDTTETECCTTQMNDAHNGSNASNDDIIKMGVVGEGNNGDDDKTVATTTIATTPTPSIAPTEAAGMTIIFSQDNNSTTAASAAATDSGRESANEFDNSLDEAATQMQSLKKPCTNDFYASSGSQTKWYLKPEDIVININGNDVNDDVATSDTHKALSNFQVAESIGLHSSNGMQVSTTTTLPIGAKDNSTEIFTHTTTTNDGISVIGIKNGFTANLSQQMRAVSSPSLSDAIQETTTTTAAKVSGTAAVTTIQLSSTSATSSISEESVTAAAAAVSSTSLFSNLPTSQSVGVLQKFKRTLTNFSKNPQQQTVTATTAASTNGSVAEDATTSANNLMSASISESLATHDVTDSASGKYRFGPLIWRTSKERRKTKYNRRDKCNSGDSGIQIELENDEQFARVIAVSAGNDVASSSHKRATTIDKQALQDSPKLRVIRRSNSAKAATMYDHSGSNTTLSAKAKILKKMEMYHEREAPESLPTRSLSQPNGLETFGISKADLDESDSDSVTSHDEGPNYYPIFAEVLYSFTAAGPQELGLERGTLIEILRKEVGPWWFGRIRKEESTLVEEILDPELGWFPKEFVRIIHSPETDAFFLAQYQQQQQISLQTTDVATAAAISTASSKQQPITCITVESCNDAGAIVDENNVTTIVIDSPPSSLAHITASASTYSANVINECHNPLVTSRSVNVIMDNADIIRRSAVKELLDTEVNYVKLLTAICEGYLPAMSKRIDIFSPNSIRLIFSNISAIYKFQKRFLEALRKGIEQNQVAKVFLKMHKGFLCYSTYCNAYPRALIELESYDRIKDARTILDNCRESENLAELPLSAHLLAPVQRICRYPLHLAEIIKSAAKSNIETTPMTYNLHDIEQTELSQLDIADNRDTIDMALEAMKGITEAVNEGKRHSETIARHQASFQNFKGPPLHLHSTRFFLQIDATRQKQNLWNSSCTLFLFDNQLVYCKRDIIKRSQFIYKGRIFLDRCRVVNVRDGKMFGHTIKNSLRIYCEARDKWFDFSFRSANRKHRFLSTLALERQFGGKALYVAEMTGFEYAFEERDYSDQSDYEMPDSEGGNARLREYIYDVAMAHSTTTTTTTTTSASGDSSLPESPAKTYKYSDTLPKKSQTRDATATAAASTLGGECQTSSLGRRRLGNWFRKPKSSNSTPNHSPTHKPIIMHHASDLQLSTIEAHESNLTASLTDAAVRDANLSNSSS